MLLVTDVDDFFFLLVHSPRGRLLRAHDMSKSTSKIIYGWYFTSCSSCSVHARAAASTAPDVNVQQAAVNFRLISATINIRWSVARMLDGCACGDVVKKALAIIIEASLPQMKKRSVLISNVILCLSPGSLCALRRST